MPTSVLDRFKQASIDQNQIYQEGLSADLARKQEAEQKETHEILERLLQGCGVLGLGEWSSDGLAYTVEGVRFSYGITNPPRGTGLILSNGHATTKVHWSHATITPANIGSAILELERQSP